MVQFTLMLIGKVFNFWVILERNWQHPNENKTGSAESVHVLGCLWYLIYENREQWTGVSVPVERSRRFKTRWTCHAAVWIGQFTVAKQPRNIPQKSDVSKVYTTCETVNNVYKLLNEDISGHVYLSKNYVFEISECLKISNALII